MINRLYIENVKTKFEEVDSSAFGTSDFRDSLAILYHENSKFDNYSSRQQGQYVHAFNNEYFHKRASQPYKVYAQNNKIALDNYKTNNEDVFFKSIENRRSVRDFDKKYKISLREIYLLCHYSYGITCKKEIDLVSDGYWGYRAVPSGGALYPLEIYVLIFNGDIRNGLYHYRPDENSIELLKVGDFYEEVKPIFSAEPYVELKNATGVVLISSIFERMMVKYKERGYRFILMETGFLSQNISLICENIGLGSCMVGGYLDDKVNEFMGLDGYTETIQNIIVFGRKKDKKEPGNSQTNNF